MIVNQGKLVSVEASDFSGMAGMQGDTVAYLPNKPRGAPVVVGHSITVDGEQRTVLKSAKSAYIEGMVVLTIG